ncbi:MULTISPECIES: hypothetical protein [Burkholderia]|uniref:hypothetical protein n=1 Tax=Burkholderia TaxID=32008 RepID=UPI00104DCD77|nr:MULTISPECIES: hypothetical protein [Burkholderia]ELK6466975.1 hypothetical protein [Burkholderia contaminans]MCA7890144.1 hypothetical protein [Burkholderia contaminans]
MNSPLYIAVLIGLALALFAMFAFGFYWLATKDRPTSPQTPLPFSPSPTVIGEHDEWEAHAPYPNHALDALRTSTSISSSQAASASFALPEFDEPLFEHASPVTCSLQTGPAGV